MPTALIVGASRGLGLGLTRAFAARGYDVIATARNLESATELGKLAGPRALATALDGVGGQPANPVAEDDSASTGDASEPSRVSLRQLDIENTADVHAFSRKWSTPLDVLFVNAGVFGPRDKDAVGYTDEDILHVFRTNAVAPVRLAKLLRKHVDAERGVIAFMSSMMGSHALNASGGAEIYRASKAALNSFTQSFIAEQGEDGPTVLTLHPGWVKTDMGGSNAHLDVDTSVKGLADVVEGARGGRKHGFFDYAGQPLPW